MTPSTRRRRKVVAPQVGLAGADSPEVSTPHSMSSCNELCPVGSTHCDSLTSSRVAVDPVSMAGCLGSREGHQHPRRCWVHWNVICGADVREAGYLQGQGLGSITETSEARSFIIFLLSTFVLCSNLFMFLQKTFQKAQPCKQGHT